MYSSTIDERLQEQCNGNTTFAWNMQEFNAVKSFTLGIEHTYVDPA